MYQCMIPGCGRSTMIRSTIKNGEYKGVKCCNVCKNKYDKKVVDFSKVKSIPKSTFKTTQKRKEERKELPQFFSEMIVKLSQNPICENCGCKINYKLHPVNNIAHILPKSRYKSIMVNKHNTLFLCTEKDHVGGDKSCHSTYDNRINERVDMEVFYIAKQRFELFKELVLESGKEFEIFENN